MKKNKAINNMGLVFDDFLPAPSLYKRPKSPKCIKKREQKIQNYTEIGC